MDTKETAATITQKIEQKQLFQAEQLLQKCMTDLAEEEYKALHAEISDLIDQAEELFTEADILEEQRELESSLQKYTHLKSIAADYPGLPEAIQRVNDSITLVSALQQRNRRRKSRQADNDDSASAVSRQTKAWKSPGMFMAFSLLMLMVAGGALYKNNRSRQAPETKIDTALEGSAALLTEKPVEDLDKPEPLQQSAAMPATETAEDNAPAQQAQENEMAAAEVTTVAAVQATVPDPAVTVSPEQELSAGLNPITDTVAPAPVTLDHFAASADTAEQQISQKETPDASAGTEPEPNLAEEQSEPGPEMSGSDETRLLIQAQLEPVQDPPAAESEKQIVQSVEVADTAEVTELTHLQIQPVSEVSGNAEPLITVEVKSPQRLQLTIQPENQTADSAVATGPVPEILTQLTYIVQPDDTLGDIALKFYGAANKWPALAEVNRNKVKNNPDWLPVGLKLIIPPTAEAARVMLTLPPPVQGQAPAFPATLPAMNEE